MKKLEVLQYSEKVRTRLNIAMQNKGVTQAQVAHYMGVSPTTVTSWCKKGNIPSVTQIAELAEFLEVSPCWLAGFTGAVTGMADDNDKAVIAIIKALLQ